MYYSIWRTCINPEFDRGYSSGYIRGYDDGVNRGMLKAAYKAIDTILKAPMEKKDLSTESIQLVNFNEKKGTTVVKWTDGSITKVKVQNGDKYNPEVGLAMCIAKRAMGNKGNYNDVFKKWLPKEEQS